MVAGTLGCVDPISGPFAGLLQLIQNVNYMAGVKAGKIEFDVPGMQAVIDSLSDQMADITTAKRQALDGLGSMSQSGMETEVSGVTAAGRWLVGTLAPGTAQVSFSDNLEELNRLITYLHTQLTAVVGAYQAADAAARDELDHAVATTMTNEREG